MRRGRPTTHKVYGIQTATAAGIVMIPLAVRCILIGVRELSLSAVTTAAIVERIMHAAGASGMIGGQWRDLEAERETLTLEALEEVHRAKTGALIAAAAVIGGLAAGAPESAQRALQRYGADLGLAFQIVDDVLDVTVDHCPAGKDSWARRRTIQEHLPGSTRRTGRDQLWRRGWFRVAVRRWSAPVCSLRSSDIGPAS